MPSTVQSILKAHEKKVAKEREVYEAPIRAADPVKNTPEVRVKRRKRDK